MNLSNLVQYQTPPVGKEKPVITVPQKDVEKRMPTTPAGQPDARKVTATFISELTKGAIPVNTVSANLTAQTANFWMDALLNLEKNSAFLDNLQKQYPEILGKEQKDGYTVTSKYPAHPGSKSWEPVTPAWNDLGVSPMKPNGADFIQKYGEEPGKARFAANAAKLKMWYDLREEIDNRIKANDIEHLIPKGAVFQDFVTAFMNVSGSFETFEIEKLFYVKEPFTGQVTEIEDALKQIDPLYKVVTDKPDKPNSAYGMLGSIDGVADSTELMRLTNNLNDVTKKSVLVIQYEGDTEYDNPLGKWLIEQYFGTDQNEIFAIYDSTGGTPAQKTFAPANPPAGTKPMLLFVQVNSAGTEVGRWQMSDPSGANYVDPMGDFIGAKRLEKIKAAMVSTMGMAKRRPSHKIGFF